MPIRIRKTAAGGSGYGWPFIGPVDHTVQLKVDVSALTLKEVDKRGYLKPGVPFKRNGTLIGAGEKLYGVSVEATRVAESNSADDLAAAVDPFVAVATIAQVNRDIVEDNLARALTADEVAAFDAAGSKISLTNT